MLNKSIFLFFTILISLSANAQFKTETEMKKFFEKSQKCSLAIGIVNPSITGKTKGEKTLVNLVMCIADFSAQEETINEQKGCGFAIYNVLKNKLSTPYATALDGSIKS